MLWFIIRACITQILAYEWSKWLRCYDKILTDLVVSSRFCTHMNAMLVNTRKYSRVEWELLRTQRRCRHLYWFQLIMGKLIDMRLKEMYFPIRLNAFVNYCVPRNIRTFLNALLLQLSFYVFMMYIRCNAICSLLEFFGIGDGRRYCMFFSFNYFLLSSFDPHSELK